MDIRPFEIIYRYDGPRLVGVDGTGGISATLRYDAQGRIEYFHQRHGNPEHGTGKHYAYDCTPGAPSP